MELSGDAFYQTNTTITDTSDGVITIGNTTSTIAPESSTNFDQEVKIIINVSAPIIFIVGLVGNSLTLMVMLFGPSLKKLNAGVYFSALALVDTLCLCVQRLTRDWLEYVFDIMLDVISVAGCKTLMFIHYFSSTCGSWLIVAVTIERLFVVCFPLKAKVMCTRRFAITIVIIIVLLSMLANVHTLFLFDVYFDPRDSNLYCTQGKEAYKIATTIVDFTMYSFLPSIALWTSNAILIAKLFANDTFRRSSTCSNSSMSSQQQQISSMSKTSLMLLSVSFTFLFLTTPTSLYYVIQNLAHFPETSTIYLVRQCLNVLGSLNPAINFFLYCLSGPMFRRDLMKIFRQCCCTCQQNSQGNDSYHTHATLRKNLASLCCRCHCICSRRSTATNDDDSSMQSTCLPCREIPYTAPGMGSRQQIYRLDSSQSVETMPSLDALCVATGAAFLYGDTS